MFNNILVPLDLGDIESAKVALERAKPLILPGTGQLHLLTVLPTFGMPIVGSFFDQDFESRALGEANEALLDLLTEFDKEHVVSTKDVRHGTIYEEIIRKADELKCDLIVMTGHRPEMKDYLLGPNAARVVRHANQSVLVVRN